MPPNRCLLFCYFYFREDIPYGNITYIPGTWGFSKHKRITQPKYCALCEINGRVVRCWITPRSDCARNWTTTSDSVQRQEAVLEISFASRPPIRSGAPSRFKVVTTSDSIISTLYAQVVDVCVWIHSDTKVVIRSHCHLHGIEIQDREICCCFLG